MPATLAARKQAAGMQMGIEAIRRSEAQFGRKECCMKMRIAGLLAVASLILAFAFIVFF